MGGRLFAWVQLLLPQHALSRLVGRLALVERRGVKNVLIRGFMRMFKVDMTEAVEPEPTAYPTFNAFFTRALVPGSRTPPGDASALSCPVDGTVSESAALQDGRLLQAKGFRFELAELLGGEPPPALVRGTFATMYLAPWNYHRIHCPADARLVEMRYVPGRLFSVNGATVDALPRLFVRNERVACLFETAFGPMAVVLVGALNVGSIETTWAGVVAPGPGGRRAGAWRYPAEGPGSVRLARGEELGRFNMGSTVIVVLPEHGPRFAPEIARRRSVRVGQLLAS
jgi:phosphatidylserine decarboxylase